MQREIPMGREASPPPSSMRHYKSQERTSERDETSSRDNRDRRERHRNKSAKVVIGHENTVMNYVTWIFKV